MSWLIGLIGSSEFVRKLIYVGIILLAIVAFLMYQKHLTEKLVRQAEEIENLRSIKEIKENEVDVLLNPPSDRDVIDRLRDGSF